MYFKTENKDVVQAVNSVIESRKKYRDGVVKLLDEFGAKSAGQFSDGRCAGFYFENGIPEGWRKPSQGYSWPKKVNKEAWEKIKELPELLSTQLIAKAIGFGTQFKTGSTRGSSLMVNCPACFVRDQIAYFRVDDDLTFEPPGHFIEILASEYQKANAGSTGEDATG